MHFKKDLYLKSIISQLRALLIIVPVSSFTAGLLQSNG